MTQVKKPTKAKRKLSDISFEHEGAHIALVSKTQKGPANGHDYALVLKATKFSDEFVEKVQQIRVTMELPEFLQRFFSMYREDAELLAKILGYESVESPEMSYEDYLKEKVKSFEIIKSFEEADSIADVISHLDEEEYLQLLKDQQMLEKAIKQFEKNTTDSAKSRSISTEENDSVEKSVEPDGSCIEVKKEKEPTMQKNDVEVVAKAELDILQKAFEEQKAALEKAQAIIAQYEQEKKEAIAKSRKAELVSIVKDESKAEVLFKALGLVETEEDYKAVLKALGEIVAAVEKSALFEERGVQLEQETVPAESAVAKVLKARLNKKQ